MSFTDTAHQTGGLVVQRSSCIAPCWRERYLQRAWRSPATSCDAQAGVVRAAAGSLRWNPCPQREVVQSGGQSTSDTSVGCGRASRSNESTPIRTARVSSASSQIFRSPRSYLAHNARSIFISWANPSCVNPGFSRCSRIRFATSRFKYPFSS